MELIIRPLSQTLGAEIRGLDISKPLDAETVATVTGLWHEHIVLLFRDQAITGVNERLEAFRSQRVFDYQIAMLVEVAAL